MTKDYDGDYYFPAFAKIPTTDLKRDEKSDRENAEKAKALADAFEDQAEMKLWEQNYRKHIAVLKPMREESDRLRKIINDGETSNSARAKAARADDALYKSFWFLMKHGKDIKPEKP